ncbi:tRNA (guanine(26)-N(2))-dimethyltransferase [Rhipicephalus sanguineus]|uniref:tRNA (guanine(26)-N(2))-dimethyltransferase n=1 Tax=Rhipicephalus sanguineus TaxID=34632 RepID=UPI0020C597D8|nr:tRNA (guanine(26)-N(2))-dimethyltransferase [Rhipicephalus sanguineus]
MSRAEATGNGGTVETNANQFPLDLVARIDKTPQTSVTEGKAEVFFPSSHDVFYNPVQEFNRDMSVAVIQEFIATRREELANEKTAQNVDPQAYKVSILEALAASGLRSIRYALEISSVGKILANDYSTQAVESMKANIEHNKVGHIVVPNRDEAALLMHMHKTDRFDVIDLDPYGSPAPFLDAAVQAVQDRGLLLVTCTDMAILCGNSSDTCRAKYGAVSLKTKCCHEMALRIILQSIESHANRYGRYTVPLLAISVDFYVRVFVRVYTGPAIVKRSTSKLGMVYQCSGCETFSLQPLGRCTEKGSSFKFSPALGPPVGLTCSHCGHKHHIGGPVWINPMHDVHFIQRLIRRVTESPELYGTSKRMLGILHMLDEELEVPLYFLLDRLASTVRVSTPSMLNFRSALLNAGHRVSLSHACKNSIKTDAPMDFVWDIIRTWKLQNPSKRPLEPGSPGEYIMRTEPSSPVNFSIHPDANPSSREQQLLRYQVNPEPCWGPKARAKTSLWADREVEKSRRLQGKRKLKEAPSNDTSDEPSSAKLSAVAAGDISHQTEQEETMECSDVVESEEKQDASKT